MVNKNTSAAQGSTSSMTDRRRWAYWLFVLVLGPLATIGLYVALGGTADTDHDPSFALLPELGAVVVPLVALPWAIGEARGRFAVRALAAAVLGPVLSSAWAITLFIVALWFACHGKQDCI
jgi:hypothetical protein